MKNTGTGHHQVHCPVFLQRFFFGNGYVSWYLFQRGDKRPVHPVRQRLQQRQFFLMQLMGTMTTNGTQTLPSVTFTAT